jgi:hypothetical protein
MFTQDIWQYFFMLNSAVFNEDNAIKELYVGAITFILSQK